MAPINAEALPAFLAKGASVSPAVLGLDIPKQARNKNSIAIVSYNPKRPFTEQIKKVITITDCATKAPYIIFSLENHFSKTELSWLANIKLSDMKAKIQPYVLASTLKISIHC